MQHFFCSLTEMIRELKEKNDKEKATKLAVLCFHELVSDMERFFSEIEEFNLIGTFEGDSLLATVGTYDFQIFIRNQLLDCAGVAYVMTDPVYRRKGKVKELMNKILLDSKAKGYPVSALWPFEHDFYRKFGFEKFEKTTTFKFKPGQIKSDFKLKDNYQVEEVTNTKDYQPLIQIATKAQKKWNRVISKTAAWMVRGPLQNFKMYLFKRDNDPVAYICINFKKVGEWDYDMKIMDMAFIDTDAKHSLFAFIRNFSADITKVHLNLPYTEEVESYLDSVLEDCKFNQWPAMLRILDIKKSFESLAYPTNLKKNLLFYVEDPLIKENSGVWQLAIENGKCVAHKVDTPKENERVLQLTLLELSQLLSGYASIDKILEHKNVLIPKEWLDKHLFPEVQTAVMVWF